MIALLGLALAGSPAPTLEVAHWLPEAPPTDERLVLVEIWATWCGPCRESFPVLATLAQKHPDTLSVVALSDERVDLVRRFVADHPPLQLVHVGVVSEATTQAFLFGGFEGRGIPSAYLIAGGEVVWSGPPEGAPEAVTKRLAPPSAGDEHP